MHLELFDYSLVACEVPEIRGKSTGFILVRRNAANPPDAFLPLLRAGDFIGLETASRPEHDFERWKKSDRTGLVEINFPNMRSDNHFCISRKYLETVYL